MFLRPARPIASLADCSAKSLPELMARLERAFQGAVETFYRVKRGHTQVIRVEKIEIQPGAQAIVGQVSRG